ncbi:MAG: lysostaphin resistance A-like protein [Planctomycetota bacterium]
MQLVVACALFVAVGAHLWGGLMLAVAVVAIWPPVPMRPLALPSVLATYAVGLVLWLLFAIGYLQVMAAIGQPVAPQPLLEQLVREGTAMPGFWLSVLVATLAAPVFEEIVFRGFLFTGFARLPMPMWATQAVVAVLFGLVHGLPHALPIAVLSLVFGRLRARHGSLLPSMLAHALHNSITIGLLIVWPELLDLFYARGA